MKYLLILLLFFSNLTYSQILPKIDDIILNHDKSVEVNRLRLFNSSIATFSTYSEGYEILIKKSKEIYYYNNKLNLIVMYTFYCDNTIPEILNQLKSIDPQTLKGNSYEDNFVVYGYDNCYCLIGERYKKKYKLTYIWDCY